MREVLQHLSNIRRWVDVNDFIASLGLGMIGAGLWMIYPPAALIIIGAVLFIIGLLRSRG